MVSDESGGQEAQTLSVGKMEAHLIERDTRVNY